VVSALAVLLVVVVPASARGYGSPRSTPGQCDWQVVASPNEGQDSALKDVLALSSTNVWAVGTAGQIRSGDGPTAPLIEHWDGSAWTAVPSPFMPKGQAELRSIDGVASNDLWAVGFANSHALVEHWDGTIWSLVQTPRLGTTVSLDGVAAVSPTDVWAIGAAYAPRLRRFRPIAEHWDGSVWTATVLPWQRRSEVSPGGIVALSSTDVWATGYWEFPDRDRNPTSYHWDGSAWSEVLPPSPLDSDAFDISASGPNDAWIVGLYFSTQGPIKTLVEHWDGTTWSYVRSPNHNSSDAELFGVVAINSADAWAVGHYYAGGTQTVPLAEQWDGTRWNTVETPPLTENLGILDAVDAAPNGDLWAVGQREDVSETTPLQTLVESRCAG